MSDGRSELIARLRQCGRDFVDQATPVLKRQRGLAPIDLYDPVADHVVSGLFARQYRFLQTYVLDFHIWAVDMGRIVLRVMLETLIYLKYLTFKDDLEQFREFVKYGLGQELLYKGQLGELSDQGKISKSRELDEYLSAPVDNELSELSIKVKLKNFDDVRKLAEECGLKDLYVLYYQPFSVTVHGHWPELRRSYLLDCQEPLHKFHLQPNFALPDLDFNLVSVALDFFLQSYNLWTKRYGLTDELTDCVTQYKGCTSSNFQKSTPNPEPTPEKT